MTTTSEKHVRRAASESANAEPLVVSGLHKSFGSQKVLDGVDLTAERGQTVVVLGRSGTGKSVLLKLIVGLQQPDSGSIRIHGQEIVGLEMDRLNEIRKKIGFLFQQAALYDSLTVEENVEFPLNRHTTLSDAERREKARTLLASVGMEQRLEQDALGHFRRNAKAGGLGQGPGAGSRRFCSSMSPRRVSIRSPRLKSAS